MEMIARIVEAYGEVQFQPRSVVSFVSRPQDLALDELEGKLLAGACSPRR